MPHYKLTYYDILGLGEPIRYIFALAGVEFEDNRIQKNEKTYPKLPPEIKDTLPWGSMPVLEVDGKLVAQSSTVARFLANRFNLAGKDEFERAKCDELVDAVRDFGSEWRVLLISQDEKTKAEVLTKLKDTTVPYYMKKFSEVLVKNGGEWFVGSSVTWTDAVIAHFFTLIMERTKFPLVEPFPPLKKFMDNFYGHPKIKDWVAKRPKSEI